MAAGGFKASLPRFVASLALLAVAAGLMLLFSQVGNLFFPAYRSFSKGLMLGLSSISSIVPFSIWDLLAIPLALALIVTLIRAIVRTHSLWRWLATVCVIASAMILFLVGAWGLNHYAPPLATELNLEVGTYSADELEEACGSYLDAAASYSAVVPRDAENQLQHQDFYELARICGASYASIDTEYPIFQGSTTPVKALLLAGEPLLYWGNTGIFWPFTGEANVPLNCADADIPFIMCHEAAHRLGLASEQEANFAAFLACSASDDARLQYAGYFQAFGYCYNALAANYPEHAEHLIQQKLGENPDFSNPDTVRIALVFIDRQTAHQHYQAYKGPVEEIGTAANDAYLKSFSEEDGVKSYGQVVDYLIAWHQAGH